MLHYQEKEFFEMLLKFNALYPDFQGWNYTNARKEHVDEFGSSIEVGDEYFKLSSGTGWGNEIKLSKKSMDIVLFITLGHNRFFKIISEKIINQRLEHMKSCMERLNQHYLSGVSDHSDSDNVKQNKLKTINTEDLSRLVWSKPTSTIAKELGVSDSAIGKRCKKDGIEKPPRGFWAQVKAKKQNIHAAKNQQGRTIYFIKNMKKNNSAKLF
jgi:hypothetical protein